MRTDRLHSMPLWPALLGAGAIGALTAVQARINGLLGVAVEDGVFAGFLSFAVGLTLLAVVVPLLPKERAALGRAWRGLRARTIPWWMLVGGACGALTVSTQGLTVALLGVSLFTVGVVAGQAFHGLLLDRIGIGPAGVVAITRGRVAGGLLALAAVAVSLSGDVLASAPLWMLVLPFLAGAGIAFQQAVNGRLGQHIQAPLSATFISFLVGTAVLVVLAATSAAVQGPPAPLPGQWWLYLGGPIGVVYILLSVVVVVRTGVLLMGLGVVLGQLMTSVVIDLLWPSAAGPQPWQVIAMVALSAASVLVALLWRRR